MNTIEKNKLIAEFMGYRYYPYDCKLKKERYDLWGWRKHKRLFPPMGGLKGKIGSRYYLGRHHKDLKFHEDWNWIMNVVEKIRSISNKQNLGYDKNLYDLNIGLLNIGLLNIDINIVWKSVVIFIETHNKK